MLMLGSEHADQSFFTVTHEDQVKEYVRPTNQTACRWVGDQNNVNASIHVGL